LGRLKTFGKLLAQADLHLVLSRIDAVFSQASGLDIAVENSNVMPTLGKLLRSNIPAGPAPTTNTVFTQSSNGHLSGRPRRDGFWLVLDYIVVGDELL